MQVQAPTARADDTVPAPADTPIAAAARPPADLDGREATLRRAAPGLPAAAAPGAVSPQPAAPAEAGPPRLRVAGRAAANAPPALAPDVRPLTDYEVAEDAVAVVVARADAILARYGAAIDAAGRARLDAAVRALQGLVDCPEAEFSADAMHEIGIPAVQAIFNVVPRTDGHLGAPVTSLGALLEDPTMAHFFRLDDGPADARPGRAAWADALRGLPLDAEADAAWRAAAAGGWGLRLDGLGADGPEVMPLDPCGDPAGHPMIGLPFGYVLRPEDWAKGCFGGFCRALQETFAAT